VTVETALRQEAIFDAVYAEHYAPLVRLAYLTTGSVSAVEDVVQDAFVEWLRRGDDVRDPAAYLRPAVVSRCTSCVRRLLLERRHSATEPPRVATIEPDAPAVRTPVPAGSSAACRGLPPVLPRSSDRGDRCGARLPSRHCLLGDEHTHAGQHLVMPLIRSTCIARSITGSVTS
jgi:DNA-directed RNA polymerase specialized sigma24 family protein